MNLKNYNDMERETIKKAAEAHFNQKEFTKEENYIAKVAFFTGAQWRINSVWHDCQKELPKREGEQILLEAVLDGKTVYIPVMWVNDGKGATESMTRWAYISDLIPDIN